VTGSTKCWDEVLKSLGRASTSPLKFLFAWDIAISRRLLLIAFSVPPLWVLFASSGSPRILLGLSSGAEENPRRIRERIEEAKRRERGCNEAGPGQNSLRNRAFILQFEALS
jgi:hypothetical protein